MFEGLSGEEKLRAARQLFEQVLTDWDEWLRTAADDLDFVAGRTQWTDAAKRALEAEDRPALVFNLTGVTIRELAGAQEDSRRKGRVVPVGTEDLPLSEVYQQLWSRVDEQAEISDAEAEVFDQGIIPGMAALAIDAYPTPGRPDQVTIEVEPVSPLEILADPAAQRRNYRDGRMIFRHRWVSVTEFKRDYPELAPRFDELLASVRESSRSPYSREVSVPPEIEPLRSRTWFRQESDQQLLRIVRLEYEQPLRRFYAWDFREDPRTGRPVGWTEVKQETYEGLRRAEVTQVREEWDREIRWLEYVGHEILYDDVNPLPIDGFSVELFVAQKDYRTHRPFGVVRDLKDPQREVNKRYSQATTHYAAAGMPGYIAEQSAIPDRAKFESAIRTPGSAAIVNDRALAESRIRERPTVQLPAGPTVFSEQSLAMFQRISGFAFDPLIGERSGTEPVGTAFLRYRRMLQSISPILRAYRLFQKNVQRKVMQIVTRGLPDAQLEAMLGDTERLRVRDGVVLDLEARTQIPIGDIRRHEFDVRFDVAEDDTIAQIIVLQTLSQLQATGVPIAPEVLVEELPLPRDKRQKLLQHIEQQAQAQAQAQQAQLQVQQQGVQSVVQVEAAKVQERARRTTLEHQREVAQVFLDTLTKILKVFVEGDQAEKDRLLELLGLFKGQAVGAAQRLQAVQ